MDRLEEFNNNVRAWANHQLPKYRKSALAFGHRCNVELSSFTGTLDWVSKLSRRYGYGVCRRKLAADLTVFKKYHVIDARHQRHGDKNAGSIYRVHFDRVIGDNAFLPQHRNSVWECPVCKPSRIAYQRKEIELANLSAGTGRKRFRNEPR